jgi:hypothetical protein
MSLAELCAALEQFRSACGDDFVFSLSWDGKQLSAAPRRQGEELAGQYLFDPPDFDRPLADLAATLAAIERAGKG